MDKYKDIAVDSNRTPEASTAASLLSPAHSCRAAYEHTGRGAWDLLPLASITRGSLVYEEFQAVVRTEARVATRLGEFLRQAPTRLVHSLIWCVRALQIDVPLCLLSTRCLIAIRWTSHHQ
jgi:hypothetical protein